MSNLIALDKWCQDTGIPRTTFKGWKRRLERGRHYFVVGKTTIVDAGEIEEWLKVSGGNTELGKLGSEYTGKTTRHPSNSPTLTLV